MKNLKGGWETSLWSFREFSELGANQNLWLLFKFHVLQQNIFLMRTAVRPFFLSNSLKFYLFFSFFWWHPSTFHFQEIIKNKKEDFVLQNEEASVKYCQVKLDEISKTLMESILKDTFCSWRLWTLQESKGKIWTGLSSSAQKRSEGKYT